MKILVYLSLGLASLIAFATSKNNTIDCSEAYGGKAAQCQVIACDAKYKSFIGTWSGPFTSYVRELSTEQENVYRPFHNVVTYSEHDCLKNVSSGDTFIIGRRTDTYPSFRGLPAQTTTGLLITGRKADGSPFLKTVDNDGENAYTLIYQNKIANMSVWNLTIEAKGDNPEMRFTTIDGQDFSESSAHKRNVTVTMSVGPAESPFWEGVVSSGYHSKSDE